MSYTESQVAEMIKAIGDKFNLHRGQVESRFEALEKQGDAIERATALRAGPAGGGLGSAAPRIYASLGEQLLDVRAMALRPGGEAAVRLAKVQAVATGAGESVPSDGGFLVEKTLMAPLTAGVFDVGLLAKRCFLLPVGGNANGLKIPAVSETSRANGSRFGGVQSYWAAEAAAVTATKPKYRLLELNLHKLFALTYATDELMGDVPALGQILTTAFQDEMSFKVDDAIVNGTGVGQPLGILNSGALVTVNKETGQRAATLLFENIIKMFGRMLPRSRKNACWLINQSVEQQLYQMSLSVGTGGVPVYLPASGAAGQPNATLFGLPVIVCEQCQALGTVGDIILADLSSYLLADKGGVQSAASIHVAFVTDETAFRWTYRLDGTPLLAAPITPFKGSDTLSSLIALQTRA
jgi:HK97 family phage major capsid protein